ncbi:hypothetical protein [Methylocucumis oryzae]|uniref:DUF3782 domain-containing protein n=1 Tax=Methylocucumis oryzae TaxID=1632867 RepID=A0A0F3IN80_9GAMM|nr:hypothetical protein [Methylocucumis oryzae]KJV08102.1 hypothetical protein VZ94_00305 [Methylocucumis oryzae]
MSTVTRDEVWELFREVARSSAENSLQLAENSLQLKETDRLIKELRESQKETDRQFKETDRKFKETDRKINELNDLFTSQWGRLMESLVEGDLVKILNQRGIAISDTSTRLKGKRADGGNFEFDILAHNGHEVVVIEVKTTLRPDDVKKFLHKLGQMKQWLPRYANNTLYGGVAWLTAVAGAEDMAVNQGLFSIRATGNSASIVNTQDFRPKAW